MTWISGRQVVCFFCQGEAFQMLVERVYTGDIISGEERCRGCQRIFLYTRRGVLHELRPFLFDEVAR